MNDKSYALVAASLAVLVVGSARLTMASGFAGLSAWPLLLVALAALVLVVSSERDR